MRTITLLALALLASFPPSLRAQDVGGTWNGVLDANGTRIRLVFHIVRSDGGWATTMDSPDQRLTGLPVTTTTFRAAVLRLELQRIGAVYAGARAGDSIVGTWTQGPATLPLVLTRGIAVATAHVRPQEPVRPYPYHEEDVAIRNARDSVTLAATLTRPPGAGPHPAVVLVSGSGPQNRDEEVFGHRPFLVLADQLTRQGIAVLRYDDRGVGGSTGRYGAATTRDFATDAASAVAFLATRRDIDARRVGIIGHSEGALVATMVAAARPDVAFVVLLAGTGLPGREVSLLQLKTLRQFPVPDEAAFARMVEGSIAVATSTADVATKRVALARHYEAHRPLLSAMLPAGASIDAFITGRVAELTTPWHQFFLAYDPATDLAKVTVPVLSLHGGRDVQVPPALHQPGIARALEAGGNRHHAIRTLPGLNHMLQESATGAMGEYARIEQTISPLALDEIVAWIRMRAR